MEDSRELTLWILKNAAYLNLKIERPSWIKNFLPQMTDLMVTIRSGPTDFVGYAYGESEDLALIKAFAEAAERALVAEFKFPTSSGCAAHLDASKAKASAAAELHERDLFLCHFYTKTPLLKFENKIESKLEKIYEWLNTKKIGMNYFRLGNDGVLVAANGQDADKPFGFVIGAARKQNIEDTIYSATIEAFRQVIHYVESRDPLPELTIKQFYNKATFDFRSHGHLALNLDYAALISFLFEEEPKFHPDFGDNLKVSVDELFITSLNFADCPLKFAKAHSKEMQEIFVGPPKLASFNLSRLSSFARRKLEFADINQLPHPFN